VHPIREDNRYGGLRAAMQARLAQARIHVQIDVGFGHTITPGALNLEFPTLLRDMASPHVLAYPTETIIAEKAQAMVDLGTSNSRMKDFSDVAIAARRVAFDGESLVVAIRATFRRRGTPLPDGEIVALSERFVQQHCVPECERPAPRVSTCCLVPSGQADRALEVRSPQQ
jgi:hypothetical protein